MTGPGAGAPHDNPVARKFRDPYRIPQKKQVCFSVTVFAMVTVNRGLMR
jgi:hypothetical protein